MKLLIAKVGGSLFDMPELGPALRHWIERQPEDRILLVAGGGELAEALRKYQPIHGLSETESHWLAVRTLGITARMLAAMLDLPLADRPSEFRAVIDAHTFLEAEGGLPKSWDVTTDSIAAHAGLHFGATRLVLLKSRRAVEGADWRQLADAGYVDRHFPTVAAKCNFPIECCDFRGASHL